MLVAAAEGANGMVDPGGADFQIVENGTHDVPFCLAVDVVGNQVPAAAPRNQRPGRDIADGGLLAAGFVTELDAAAI